MKPHRVGVLIRDGVLPIELGIVHRLFGEARSAAGEPLYEVRTCSLRAGPVRTDADVTVTVDHGPELLATVDTVVIPASADHYEPRDSDLEPRLAEAMAQIRPGARVASICTGSFVLAAAGLLDGKAATTHWRSAERFARLFPSVRLRPEVLYTEDGDVYTSAGVASGIDLCLHLIRADHGTVVANEVARGTVVAPYREGGQAQFIKRPVPEPRVSSTGRARDWALRHLDRPVSLHDLAAAESMSTRTFTRRFRDEVGMSPGQWLTGQRIERARELLEQTDLSVDRVAADVGFGTAVSLRQHLQAAIGVTPSAYRATFRRPPDDLFRCVATSDGAVSGVR